jgi:hypothetical protein
MSEQLDQMRLPIDNLVDIVISEPLYHTDKVFDYLWSLIPSEVSIYKLVSKCFFFQSDYVVTKLMTKPFPPSLIVIFIKRTKLGLTPLMFEFLKRNQPSGTDLAFLLFDSPHYLNESTFDLFVTRAKTYHEVMAIIDHAKGLTEDQREILFDLCVSLAVDQDNLTFHFNPASQ